MPPEAGVIFFFHTLFHRIPLEAYVDMLSDIRQKVVPALVKESVLSECSTLPAFSHPTVRAKCKNRILLLYISCVGNVWEVLHMNEDGVHLSDLLSSTSFTDNHCINKNSVKGLSLLHDTIFMAAVLRCIQNNEGYATLLLFAITEHYERLFHQRQVPFSIIDQNSTTLTPEMSARFETLATIANDAMSTLFGAWSMGKSVKLKSSIGTNIILHNEECYAFTLALYNLSCVMEGGGTLVWDPTLFSTVPPTDPLPEHTEQFLNQVSLLEVNFAKVFLSLDKPLSTYLAGPISTADVMLSIQKDGFGKAESLEFPLEGASNVHVNAFTKNRVVTQYILCPGLSSISCFNEAYIRNTRTSKRHMAQDIVENNNITEVHSPVKQQSVQGNNTTAPSTTFRPIGSSRRSGQMLTGKHYIRFPSRLKIDKPTPYAEVQIVGYAGQNTTTKRHVYIYNKSPDYKMITAISDFCQSYNHLILDCSDHNPDWSSFSNTTQLLVLANFNQSTCLPFQKFKALADRTSCFFSVCGIKQKRVKVTPRKDLQMIILSSRSPYDMFGVLDTKQHRVVMNSIQIRIINARFTITRLDGNASVDRVFAEKIVKCNRRFVLHSNKISTGLGTCTFSIYKTQDNKGVGSCINTFNFHTSGNYLDLCISRAAVELDIMKSNPTRIYPVAIPISVQHNTCTTVDLPGILNPETALQHTEMHFGSTPRQLLGPTKTTRFPAHNVFVKHPNAIDELLQNILPAPLLLARSKNKRPYNDSGQADGEPSDNCPPPRTKRARAYAVFDDNGIVCDPQRYTPSMMKQLSSRFVSWELHKNNINTSYFNGNVLQDKLQLVLSWYLGQDGVEFNVRKQNLVASVEKKAGALLPFSVLFLIEMEYIMKNLHTSTQLNMQELFVSRSMICTYGHFSRGNAYMPLLSKNILSHISTQHKFKDLQRMYGMCEGVLRELVGNEGMEIGQVRSLFRNCTEKEKSHMPLCSTRSRSEGVVPSLMYGSEHFVRKFLDTVPVLKALKLSLKKGSDSMQIVSLLEQNYMR